MAIPSSIQIPDLYVQDPMSAAIQSGLSSYQKMQALKQQKQAQDLKQQLEQSKMEQQQQMQPLQQQLMKAQIDKTQAETQGMPIKAQMDMMLKQRAQDNKIIELGSQNADLMRDPQFAKQYQQAQARVSQDLAFSGQPQQQGQAGLQAALQPAGQPQQPVQPPIGQQTAPQTQPEIADQMLFRQEQKNMPADIKNQMTRSASATLMIDDLKDKLTELKPFFGVGGSLKGAFRAYAASKGLSDDDAAIQYNTLSKRIMSTAGEVAAGMTKSRSEATLKEWQDIVNPITSKGISFKQVMANVGALENIHDSNSRALFENYPVSKKHHDNWLAMQRKNKVKNVPRETIQAPQPQQQKSQQYSQDAVLQEIARRKQAGLM